jgi:RNA polymerase sigma-70 factor (ECF subfamily)
VAEIEGPGAALAILNSVCGDARVIEYQPYWAARADLLARIGASAEARDAYEIAIGLERDPSLRNYLERRRARLPRR